MSRGTQGLEDCLFACDLSSEIDVGHEKQSNIVFKGSLQVTGASLQPQHTAGNPGKEGEGHSVQLHSSAIFGWGINRMAQSAAVTDSSRGVACRKD